MKADPSIFDFTDYRVFLKEVFKMQRGAQVRMSEYLNIQPSSLAQAVAHKTHLSQEILFRIARKLRMNRMELEYLLLIYQANRTSNAELSGFLIKAAQSYKEEGKVVRSRLQNADTVVVKNIEYFGSLFAPAVHSLAMLDSGFGEERLKEKLGMNADEVKRTLSLLLRLGLIARSADDTYKATSAFIHLDRKDPLVKSLHTNSRWNALRAIDRNSSDDLHYSSYVCLAEEDFLWLKESLLALVKNLDERLESGANQRVVGFNFDFFPI